MSNARLNLYFCVRDQSSGSTILNEVRSSTTGADAGHFIGQRKEQILYGKLSLAATGDVTPGIPSGEEAEGEIFQYFLHKQPYFMDRLALNATKGVQTRFQARD